MVFEISKKVRKPLRAGGTDSQLASYVLRSIYETSVDLQRVHIVSCGSSPDSCEAQSYNLMSILAWRCLALSSRSQKNTTLIPSILWLELDSTTPSLAKYSFVV